MNYLVELILKLAKVDRRWIFLIIGFVVTYSIDLSSGVAYKTW